MKVGDKVNISRVSSGYEQELSGTIIFDDGSLMRPYLVELAELHTDIGHTFEYIHTSFPNARESLTPGARYIWCSSSQLSTWSNYNLAKTTFLEGIDI